LQYALILISIYSGDNGEMSEAYIKSIDKINANYITLRSPGNKTQLTTTLYRERRRNEIARTRSIKRGQPLLRGRGSAYGNVALKNNSMSWLKLSQDMRSNDYQKITNLSLSLLVGLPLFLPFPFDF